MICLFIRMFIFVLCHTLHLFGFHATMQNIIIPKELREIAFPPLDGLICTIQVLTKSQSSNVVDLVDAILWISPRFKNLFCYSYNWSCILKVSYCSLLLFYFTRSPSWSSY